MDIVLKRIRYDRYDELLDSVDFANFFANKNELERKATECSEPIVIDGQNVTIKIDTQKYLDIVKRASTSTEASIQLGIAIREDFVTYDDDGNPTPLPMNIMFSPEFWTYMNIVFLFDVVKERYIKDGTDADTLKGKIIRNYFNKGKEDRTGLRYCWIIADALYNGTYDLLPVGWSFIDPLKGIAECVLGRNKEVLQAFAKAVLFLGKDARIRNSKYKTVIPKHLRSFACSNFVDSYETVDELALVFADQMLIALKSY